jgi:hypothetical protein
MRNKIIGKIAKLTLILFVFIFVGIQLVPTATIPKTSAKNGVHMAETIDPQVGAILDRSCQDCHSSSASSPWYSHVAPVSWIVSKDVTEGRELLDLAEWANQPPTEDARREICDAVSKGRMPLPEYTIIHRHTKLSKRDVELICDWADAPGASVKSPQASESTKKIARVD